MPYIQRVRTRRQTLNTNVLCAFKEEPDLETGLGEGGHSPLTPLPEPLSKALSGAPVPRSAATILPAQVIQASLAQRLKLAQRLLDIGALTVETVYMLLNRIEKIMCLRHSPRFRFAQDEKISYLFKAEPQVLAAQNQDQTFAVTLAETPPKSVPSRLEKFFLLVDADGACADIEFLSELSNPIVCVLLWQGRPWSVVSLNLS